MPLQANPLASPQLRTGLLTGVQGLLEITTEALAIYDPLGAPQLLIESTPNAVNYWRVQGATPGVAPTFVTEGTDLNIDGQWYAKGAGGHAFGNDAGLHFQVVDQGGAAPITSNLQVAGGIAGGDPALRSTRGLSVELASGQTGQLKVAGVTMGAFRNIEGNSASTAYPVLAGGATLARVHAEGSANPIGLYLSAKGTAAVYLAAAGTTIASFLPVPTGVNRLEVVQGAPGAPVQVGVQGADSNVDLLVSGKGTGLVRFGTYTPVSTEVFSGYIMIKDASGVLRKLAVLN